eukprot:6431246-Lingulodinium_polyedra.AAC.1
MVQRSLRSSRGVTAAPPPSGSGPRNSPCPSLTLQLRKHRTGTGAPPLETARWCSRWSRPGAPVRTSPRGATAPPSTGSAGGGAGAPN